MRYSCFLLVLFSLLACRSSKDSQTELPNFKTDMIELNLADRVKPMRIEHGFSSLGVRYVCTLDKLKNICVFSFDTTQNSLPAILKFLGNEVGIESAKKTRGCTKGDHIDNQAPPTNYYVREGKFNMDSTTILSNGVTTTFYSLSATYANFNQQDFEVTIDLKSKEDHTVYDKTNEQAFNNKLNKVISSCKSALIEDYQNGNITKRYLDPIVSGNSGFEYACVDDRAALQKMDQLYKYIRLNKITIGDDGTMLLDYALCGIYDDSYITFWIDKNGQIEDFDLDG